MHFVRPVTSDPAAGRQSYSGDHSGHSVRSRDSATALWANRDSPSTTPIGYPEILRERGESHRRLRKDVKRRLKPDAEEAARKIGGNAGLKRKPAGRGKLRWWVAGRSDRKIRRNSSRCRLKRWFYTMKGDQKYFPVYANDGKLLPGLYLRCQHRIERSAADYLR